MHKRGRFFRKTTTQMAPQFARATGKIFPCEDVFSEQHANGIIVEGLFQKVYKNMGIIV